MPKFQTERQMQANTLLKDGDYRDIRDMLERLSRIYPDRNILGGLDENKQIFHYTAAELYEEVMNLGDGLLMEGLQGAHIAIVAQNSCRYVIADMCISSGVGVVSPINVDSPDELLATLLQKCDANAVLCSRGCLEKIERIKDKCPLLSKIITIDCKADGYPYYGDIVTSGAKAGKDSPFRTMILDLDAPSKILFTSGTTGANKGVVLTNRNLAANILNCMSAIKARDGEENVDMSILPMHHATEINTHVLTRIASGRLTYINDNMRNMMTNMKIFRPSCVTVVPMIANAFYRNIWAGARKNGKEEKLKKGIRICNILRKVGIDKTHDLFADVFVPFGGRLNMIVCGGAMLNPSVVKGMNDLGIRMENGYGITECGPLISMNSDTLQEYRSVGKPCPGLEVKIDNPDENGVGELCVKGPSVAKGYYKDEAATAQAFRPDGFFNTGDSARIDSEGRIFLTGRKKNTIVLESGKNIFPEELENLLETEMDYAADIVVYQARHRSGRNVICTGLWIPDDNMRADRASIERDVRKVNSQLPSYMAVEYIEIAGQEYEKTSTRKIRRTSLPESCSGNGIELKG